MSETIRLSIKHDDGEEWASERTFSPIKLDEMTWQWLKGAFVAIGFDAKQVDEFFDESTDGKTK